MSSTNQTSSSSVSHIPSHLRSFGGGANPLFRIKRYIDDVAEALRSVELEPNEGLLAVERNLTLSGVSRQLVAARYDIAALQKSNQELQLAAAAGRDVPKYQDRVKDLESQNRSLKAELSQLTEDLKTRTEDHSNRYHELQRLYLQTTVDLEESRKTADQWRMRIEALESERDSLRSEREKLTTHLDSMTSHYQQCQDRDKVRLRDVEDKVAELSKGHDQRERRWLADRRQIVAEHEVALKERDNKIHSLLSQIEELRDVQRSVASSAPSSPSCTGTLRQNKRRDGRRDHNTGDDHNVTNEATTPPNCSTRCGDSADVNYDGGALSAGMSNLNQRLEEECHQWREVASDLCTDADLAAVRVPSADDLRRVFAELRTAQARLSEDLRNLEDALEAEKASSTILKDETKRFGLELKERALKIETLELQNTRLLGQLEIYQDHHQQQLSGSSNQTADGKASSNRRRKPTPSSQQGDTSSSSSVSELFNEYQQEAQRLQKEKAQLVQRAQEFATNCKTMEVANARLTSETDELHRTVHKLTSRLGLLEEELESLRAAGSTSIMEASLKERDEARVKLLAFKRYYTAEAVAIRSIIRVLLGWIVRFDIAPPGEDTVVTFKSVYAPPGDDGELVFTVMSKFPEAALETISSDSSIRNVGDGHGAAITTASSSGCLEASEPLLPLAAALLQAEVETLYKKEDFRMHVEGRFASKWELDVEWKKQLSGRNSYAAFLAITILDEHNRSLQRSALTTSRALRGGSSSKTNPVHQRKGS